MEELVEPLERRRLRRLLILVLVLIVYGSLYPFSFRPAHMAILAWVWDPGVAGIRDAVINLAIYFPVGFLAYSVIRGARTFRLVIAALLAGIVSGSMECLQAFDQGRVSSVLDLLLNIVSGALGAWIASLLPALVTGPMVVILLAIVAHTFPFVANLHFHLPAGRPAQFVYAAIDWLAVRCALTVLLRRKAVTREMTLLTLPLLAGIFIIDQTVTLATITGAVAVVAAGRLWPDRLSIRPQQLAPCMLLTVVLRELAPFHFNFMPQEFYWIPFETFLSGPQGGAVVFLEKLSLYTSTLWLLDPESRHMWRYGPALAVLLLGLEWIQRYLPGRTPDISDALIVLIAASGMAWGVGRRAATS